MGEIILIGAFTGFVVVLLVIALDFFYFTMLRYFQYVEKIFRSLTGLKK